MEDVLTGETRASAEKTMDSALVLWFLAVQQQCCFNHKIQCVMSASTGLS